MRKYSVPSSFEITVRVIGDITIDAKNKKDAIKQANTLKRDKCEFTSHIRSNGDDDSFFIDDIGEQMYHSVKGAFINRISIDKDAVEELESSHETHS
jgi:hypothetical protein